MLIREMEEQANNVRAVRKIAPRRYLFSHKSLLRRSLPILFFPSQFLFPGIMSPPPESRLAPPAKKLSPCCFITPASSTSDGGLILQWGWNCQREQIERHQEQHTEQPVPPMEGTEDGPDRPAGQCHSVQARPVPRAEWTEWSFSCFQKHFSLTVSDRSGVWSGDTVGSDLDKGF